MEIQINPDDIESFVKGALIKSSIGNVINKAVADVLARGYDNPIDKEMKRFVGEIASELICQKYKEKITVLVQEHIEKSVTDELLNKMTDAAVTKMVEAANRY